MGRLRLLALGLALLFPAVAAAAPFDIPADLGSYAVLSCKDLKIAGNSVVSSEGVGTGSTQGEAGHVRSNGDVILDGSIEVHGDAVAGPGKQVRTSGQPLVTGQRRVATTPFACSPIDLAALRTALLVSNDNARLPATEKGKPALSGPNGRTLDLSGKDTLTLPAGTYLFDEIKLTGNTRVRVDGDVRILVLGAIDIKGGSHINLDGNPFHVHLWSLGTSVAIASQSNVHAFVYAPAASALLSGQSRIVGAVQADKVDIVGGSRVRRVVDDAKLGLTVASPQEGQSVTVCTIPVTGTVTHVELLDRLTVNGVRVTPAADGSFSTMASLATADPGLVEAVATDLSGNTLRVAVRVAIVAPALALTSPDKPLVGNRIVSLAGTSGTATEVTVNGVAAQVADGAFRIDGFDLGAEDGLVDLVVVGRNCGGEVSETFVLELDTRAPVVAIDGPVQGDLFGRSPITVTGTVEDAHLKTVTVNGVAATVVGNRFTAEDVVLHEGNNNLVALAEDELGRKTSSATVTVELDSTAPTVTITEPENGALLSTAQIVVRGTVSDVNLRAVKVNGIPATVTGTTFEVAIQLAEGENHLDATAVDAANHPAESPRVTVVLDTLPPVIALAPLPALVDSSPITVRGTVSDPHLDKVTVNGIEATVVGEEFVAEVPLQEGVNAIVARAVDTLGHPAETASASVTLDTLAPVIAITEPQANAQLASRTVTVRGTVADPHLDRVTVLEVEATVTGSTLEAVVELPEGGSDLTARAVDTLGHAAVSDPVPVVVDTLAPVVRLDSPQNPLVSTATVRVTGKAEDPHLDEVTVKELPATVAPNGTFHVDAVPLVEGVNEIVAEARDTFGNESVSDPVVYVLDSTPPAIAITSPANGQVMTSLEALVTGTVSDPHLLGVTVNGVEAAVNEAAGTFSASVPLTDGANMLTAVATDLAGHTASAAVTVVLDTQPPTVTLDQPAVPAGACLAAGAAQTLGGAFADANPAAAPVTVEVTDAAGAKRTYAGTVSGTRWSAAGVDLGAADGVTTVVVTAKDVLGNTSRVSASFRIDAAPPVVRLTLDGAPFPGAAPGAAPAPGALPTLFGRRIAAGVQVEDGAAAAPPAAVLTLDGAPYAAGTLVAAEGTHLLVATATDCAGRTTAVHALFTIDVTAPALRSTTPAAGARVTAAVTTFSGVSDPDLARATVSGRPAAVSAGAFTLTPFPWREGRNEVAIELEDRAGNRATYQVAFEIKTAPLSLQVLESGAPIAPGATFLRPVRPEARASDSTATVTATLNGAPFVSGSEIGQSGSYHLVANASDGWGRTAHAEASFTLDLAAGPQIAVTSPADGAVLPGPAVRVEGTVSGDAPIVTVNGIAAAVTGGTWVVAALPLEPDVANSLVAIVRDRLGRTATAGVTVRVVSGGPQVLILEPVDGTTTNRPVIDVAGVVVGGRSADGTVTVQGRSVGLAPDGTFRALDVPLQTGSNTLTASVRDRENRPGSASVTVIADFTPPVIRFLSRAGAQEEPLLDGASFGKPITLIVEVTDDAELGSAPSIRLNGGLQAGAAPRTEIPLANSGGYVVAVAVEDAAGNQARAERSFVLDFGGCSLAGVTPAAGSAVAAASVSLVGRSGGAASIKVRVPQAGGGTQEYAAALADGTFLAGDVPLPVVGENRLELVCIDAAGAVQTLPHPIERLAAGGGPTIDITAPAAGALLGTDTTAVSGAVSSGAVTVNGIAAVVQPGSGLDSFLASTVPLSEGPNPILARTVDAAGRSAEDRIVVHRDTQAPRVQITRPDNHSQVGVAGTGPAAIAGVDVSGLVDLDTEPNLQTVVVASALGSVTATFDPLTGVFVARGVRLDPAAGAGTFQTVTATATDGLGHSGTSSVEVALDPAGPAIVLSEPADLARYAEGAAGPITVRGEAWAAPGTAVSINGVDLDPATLPWEAAGADGRRHVAFTATVNLPAADGPFGIIARATDLQGRWAQDRRLLFRDVQRPKVVEMVPSHGSSGVDPNGLMLVLFSEPIRHASLDAADGLSLTRVASGEKVVGTKTVAGQAVGFVPGAALAAGEEYVLRAGAAIADVAGNVLVAPAEARFRVGTVGTSQAPVLDPLPAVLCSDEIQVTGRAAAGSTLKARDGNLTFTGFADASGAFSLAVPITGSGFHLLAVWSLDPVSGARSPETTAVVRIDCRSPSVLEARFDRAAGKVRVVFSESMNPATLTVGGAGAAIHLLDAEVAGTYRNGTLSLPSDSTVEVQLDTAANAWWRDRPLRLQVGPPAADVEGNAMAAVFETVFFPGGGDPSGAFLFGEAYDDSTGRPFAGAMVELFASGQATPVAGAVTDGRGRFVLAGEVPAGRYALVVEGPETTRVYRRLSLRPAAGLVPFDSRVTPLAEPAGELDPVAGGTLTANGLSFTADAAALPGAAQVSVRLTPRSMQGLPDFLPLGWTPATAAEIRLEQDSAALPEQDLWTLGAARIELPLPAWAEEGDELFAARYEPGTGRWLALPEPERIAGSPARVRIAVAGPGTVAIVVPDADPATRPPVLPAAADQPLAGAERPAEVPDLDADLTLDPPVVGPTGRSRARVVARSADGTSAWPSGLAVQVYLEERLVLSGGGEVLEAPFAADLVLYHPRLTAAEQGGAAERAAGAMEFTVSPSPRAAQVLLEVGWENIRLFPFPEEVERGAVVGPDGGTVASPEGVELTIPEGALGAKVPVAATLLTTAELAELPAITGYDTLAAVRVELSGATLARPATLALPTPDGTPAETGGPRVILAELVETPADGRGSLAILASRTRRDAQRIVAAPDLAGALPLDGIVREGLYLVLGAHQPLGFATGFVRAANQVPIAQSRVTTDGLGTGDLSRLTGRYSLPVIAGADRHVTALHPALDERGTGTIPSLASGQVVSLDLTVQAVPPRVVSVTPQDGATSQPLATAVSILFSEALDPATVTSSTLKLELAGAAGEATGIFVNGTVSLVDGLRVVFALARPLLPGRTFRASFAGGVADAGGAIYAGQPLLWRFSTSSVIVPGGQVHPEKFHIRVPVNGVAQIYGDPGAMPGSLSGQTPWAVTPDIEGPVADPRRDTFQGRADGSFTGSVGHPPGFPVTIASKVWVKVFDPTGTLAAEFRVGPFTTPDGLGFVAPPGEAVTFHSAQGLVVDVPAGAFGKPTLVKIRTLDPATIGLPTPQGLAVGGFISLDFAGEAAETLRVSVPAPAQAAADAQVFIGTPRTFPWGRRLQVLSIGGVLARDGQRYLSNDPSVQPEPPAGSLASSKASSPAGVKLEAAAGGRTCQQAKQEGLPKCFLQSLLMEFMQRSNAVFYYEQSGGWAAITGLGGAFPMSIGASQEAIANSLSDLWTYVPVPHDWNGGFVLPVLADTPLELVRRDTATGWVLGRQAYDPVDPSDGLVDVGFLGGGKPGRPVLTDARPFQVIRFEAPEPPEEEPPADGGPPPLPDPEKDELKIRLSLEVEARVDKQRLVTLASVEDFFLSKGSSIALFDLVPEPDEPLPPPPDDGSSPAPPPPPEPPVAGPSLVVCDEEKPWKTEPFKGGSEMLALVGPGGVDAAELDQLELQFDRPLKDVTKKPIAEVAKLQDLGPLEKESCGSSTKAGYPKPFPFEIEQVDRGSRLVFRLSGTLPAGHRFRLEILPAAIAADSKDSSPLNYWETAPTRFEFATREVPGEPIAEVPEGEGPVLGTTNVARDMLKLGNLLLVASETGDLVAVDVSRSSEKGGLRRYAIKNKGLQSLTRSLATDGHNRVFYSGLFGSLWAVKTLRLEDVRKAEVADCVDAPEWARNLPCFGGVEGSVRIAYALGSQTGTTASEWLAAGTLPEATPMDLTVLTQDEKGKELEFAAFFKAYKNSEVSNLTPDAEGIYTFDVTLKSTLLRSRGHEAEPSLPPGTPPMPPIEAWRKATCEGEEDYDRYQRVTLDNLTTGQSWSLDIENEWPDGSGNGTAVLAGVRARRGDQLRVRYNLRTLGHLALMGSGITVVDLNRFYRLQQPVQSPGGGQCGRRLGKFEGQGIEYPSCAPESIALSGIAMTPSVVAHSKTGCGEGDKEADKDESTGDGGDGGDSAGPGDGEDGGDKADKCRGEGFIDVYSPLQRVGAVHTRSTADAPGGVKGGLFDPDKEQEALQLADLAACIQTVDDQFVMLRDVALADDVEWIYRGIHGEIDGTFRPPDQPKKPKRVQGDLLFVSLGSPGIYVFDVSKRSLEDSSQDGKALIGRLHVPGHSAFRLQVDPLRGLLFAGGTDAKDGKPVIDVWDLAAVNGAKGLDGDPTPIATLHAPWSTNQLGIDFAGTGLLYTWGPDKGPMVVPFARPRFVFAGLYRPEDEEKERGFAAAQKATARFVPLGVPLETPQKEGPDPEAEAKERRKKEEKATGAFKVRVALPGSLGPELLAKVQSLRVLPAELHLGKEEIGAAVVPPGGPGWPDNEQLVRLRRVGLGEGQANADVLDGEGGPLGTAYQLYESVETVLLLADPRARGGYTRQDDDENKDADEEAQCRRCKWPGYLPDPEDDDDPELENVEELLAGPYVRVFLFAPEPGELQDDPDDDDPAIAEKAIEDTRKAIELFTDLGEKYPLPAGSAAVAGWADSVPSPVQASLAEPPQSPAVWDAGEAGVAVALPGGELLVAATDRAVPGRALAFSLDRTYRSGMLGYGPFGSAGWSASLFAHLRELPVTGEVEYHDGMGHVWRFYPNSLEEAPEGYEKDEAGSYYAPKGLYLRLQKLSGGQGFRLLGRQHDVARFDALGRLIELSDRHHQDGAAEESTGKDQGSRIQLRYDPFGQLVTVVDDLGRRYELEYYDDPRPDKEGTSEDEGDGPRYGLLKKVTDFVDREVDYEYDEERRLTKVKLPEVKNKVDDYYREFSYEDDKRPTLEYRYYDPEDPAAGQGGVTDDEGARGALLHGDFAELRLASCELPGFVAGVSDVPRARFEYETNTGRLKSVGFPTPDNQNDSNASVEWSFTYTQRFPVEQATVRAPWGHQIDHDLDKGRITERREELFVYPPNSEAPGELPLTTRFRYDEQEEGDGRLLTVELPDGSRLAQCYADGKGGEGCDGGAPQLPGSEGDRLAKANVVRTVTTATAPDSQGTADYLSVASDASYQEDNLVTAVHDGESREIDVAVSQPAAEDTTKFSAEQVSNHFKYDRYGRAEEGAGGGAGAPVVRVGYGGDRRGSEGGGLVKRVEQGTGSSLATWKEYFRDRADNVERVETSQGSEARAEHDEWDRVVRTVTGEAKDQDGRVAAVGVAECGLGEGAIAERAFDAAGHVVRERHLQDYVDLDGNDKCRFVETRYRYNAREQLVAVEQTHLAMANPGHVDANPQPVKAIEFDEHGRVSVERTEALSHRPVLTTYTYDPAGRVQSVRTGDEGERRVGYDEMSRMVFATDGDEGVWRGRYDAWGRLYREQQPTGAVVLRHFDRAGNPIRETVYDGEGNSARMLAETRYHVTSFGAVERVSQMLAEAVGNNPPARRVTERVFDGSGRMIEVWSGPPIDSDPTRVARDSARREFQIDYEPGGGRVREERYGGDEDTAPLHAIAYRYDPESKAPWPDAVTLQEAVPGQTGRVNTVTTTYRRDAFGRPVEERRSDGSVLTSVYDRSGGVIRATTGAGTQAATTFDGRGLPLKTVRPNGRGFTLYGYDRDGALLREQTQSETDDPWETVYTYDDTGRPDTVTYADGSKETLTYDTDSTVLTRRTRDGVLVTYGYDPANRLTSATPAGAGAATTLIDAGDKLAYDELSRPTLLERGRAGTTGYDAALAVAYPRYDLASRPGSEVVGARSPFTWKYDTWNRPIESVLPAGPGRNGSGSFQGLQRSFDTLDRLTEVSGLGTVGLSPTAMGATWVWGGADRLYAMSTKGALGTALRLGYIGGAGPQLPGGGEGDPDSKWKLGTLTWGAADDDAATAVPEKVWGQFGFGWRGNEGTPSDGAKLGRQVMNSNSTSLLAGLGWAWGYDGGVRLSLAAAGDGNLTGQNPPQGSGVETFRFDYGEGDELEKIVREATGQVAELATGTYGRITSRNGAAFSYDGMGRRLEDDRFIYRWDWRGQLVSVTVKDTWPDSDGDGAPDVTPWAGHQVRYEYDAASRLTHRWHYTRLPAGETDDALRPFLEKRVFVWEGNALAAEAAYGNAEETVFRWRKTYVPGPNGLDDAVQVVVEDAAGVARTYTLLRDEMGTVIGLVAEDEGSEPDNPPVPVRYRYTPYGEAHAESGPELLRAHFDSQAEEVETADGSVTQTVTTGTVSGSLVLDWTLPLDSATLPAGLTVERLATGSGWVPLPVDEVAIGIAPSGGTSAGGGGPPAQLLVLTRSGWLRGTSYRVRLATGLADNLGRPFGRTESLEWRVPEVPATGPIPAVLFDKKIASRFESWEAAKDDLGGRFPGGQTALFQGLWTDPVTGVAYARARWYDARNASWLSEDPLLDVDSPNLYAFVGHQPNMGSDPRGELCIGKNKETPTCMAITDMLVYAIAGDPEARVEEEIAQRERVRAASKQFEAEVGRAPRPDEPVIWSPQGSVSANGKVNDHSGRIEADHAEWAVVGVGMAGRGAFVAARAAGASTGRALLAGGVEAGGEGIGEATGVNPLDVARLARGASKSLSKTAAATDLPISAGRADFAVAPEGQAIPLSQSRMRQGFDDAGFPSTPTRAPGIEHTLPDGSKVRTMEPTANAPRRASFTNANGQPIDPATGKPPQPPRGLTAEQRREYVRQRTHVEQHQ